MMRIAFALMLILLAGSLYAAGMYKWVDKDGTVQYSNTPPPPNTKNVEQRKITGNVIESSGAPFAVREASKNFPVTLWTAPECVDPCNKARALLSKRGVAFTEMNVKEPPENIETFKALSGAELSVPLAQVGKLKNLKGFQEDEWIATLDAAGYPANAPVAAPAKSAPAAKPAAAPPAAPAAAK